MSGPLLPEAEAHQTPNRATVNPQELQRDQCVLGLNLPFELTEA